MTDEDVWEKLKTGLFDMIGSCPSKKLVSSLANGTGLDEDGEAVYGVFASLLVAESLDMSFDVFGNQQAIEMIMTVLKQVGEKHGVHFITSTAKEKLH